MRDFKDIFVSLRKENDKKQNEIAKELGVSKSTIAMWETGQRKPSPELYEQIADFFNVDMDYLYGRTALRKKVHYDEDGVEYVPQSQSRIINVIGDVIAGIPIEAIEDIIGTEEISESLANTGDFFGLRIKGDSMQPRIYEGDIAIVRKQSDAESGDIVIALVGDTEATCKKLLKYDGGINLMPLNSSMYEPMFFSDKQISNGEVKIIGKVIEIRARL